MNIGIFLGSFNPPHIGHLSLVYEALDTKLVDKILVVPAFRNPWKSKGIKQDDKFSLDQEFYFRHKMCKAMFADLIESNKVIVTDVEYHLWRKNHRYEDDCIYSHETLKEITADWKHVLNIKENTYGVNEKPKFILVTTSETLVTMRKWFNGSYIMSHYPIIAMSTQTMTEEIEKKLAFYSDDDDVEYVWNNYTFKKIPDFKVHSTDLREKFVKGKTLMPFINKGVHNILYSDEYFNVVYNMYKNLSEAKKETN